MLTGLITTAILSAMVLAQAPSLVVSCGTDLTPRVFSSTIGDVDGDGISDVASSTFNNAGTFWGVQVIGSASGNVVATFLAPQGEIYFGVSVAPAGDFDGDGVPDVAIASIIDEAGDNAQGIVHVYSTVSGAEIAYIKDLSQSLVTVPDVKMVGDLDGNGIINTIDVLLLLDSVLSGSTVHDPYALDLNKDGVVDLNDVEILIAKYGNTASPTAAQTLASEINISQGELVDPSFLGLSSRTNSQLMAGGGLGSLVGCAWCAITCGSALKSASHCIGLRTQIADACAILYPDLCSLEYTECIEARERTAIRSCLNEAIRAAGSCGKCIQKCSPVSAY